MKISVAAPALIACLTIAGCVSTQIDANAKLWVGFKKAQAVTREGPVGPEGRVAPPDAEDSRPYGLRLLAHEVLGTEKPAGPDPECFSDTLSESFRSRGVLPKFASEKARPQWAAFTHVFGTSDDPMKFTPQKFEESPFLKQYVEALNDMPTGRGVTSDVDLSAGQIMEFGRKAAVLSTDHEEAEQTTVGRLFSLYVSAYLQGKFVDRQGHLYPKPSIFNSIGGDKPTITIGTDVLTGFASVALEAVTDAALRTPVPCDLKDPKKPKYFTENNREPTFAALFGDLVREQTKKDSEADLPGLTELELDLIAYVSNLAGMKSKLLAGLVFGLLDEAELEFIVGAHFKLGGNDALKALLEALFEVASRKFTEYLAHEALHAFTYEIVEVDSPFRTFVVKPVGESDNAKGRVIALLLQEQEILKRILPEKPEKEGS